MVLIQKITLYGEKDECSKPFNHYKLAKQLIFVKMCNKLFQGITKHNCTILKRNR